MATTARFLVYFLIVWAPLPLASNRGVFWAFNGGVAVLAAILFLLGETTSRRESVLRWDPFAWLLGAFVLVTIWMLVQAVPGLPASLHHPVWGLLADTIPGGSPTISINPAATWTALAGVVPVGLLFFVSARIAESRRDAFLLLNIIVATTTAVALYGLAGQHLGFRQVFLLQTVSYEGFLTGTFVGRNAAAIYFAIGLVAATSAAALNFIQAVNTAGRRPNTFLILADSVRRAGIYIVADIILVSALLNTGSRGGLIAAALGLATVAGITMSRLRAWRSHSLWIFGALFIAIVVVAAISSDVMMRRLQTVEGAEGRLAVYRDTIDMIAARPILGHGAGTFADSFPLFHLRAASTAVWNYAHNTYLQIIAELGLPVAFIAFAATGFAVALTLRELLRRQSFRPTAVAAIGAAVAVGVHSLTDFGVQVQAVGLTMAILLGAGLGDALRPSRRRSSEPALPTPATDDSVEVIDVLVPSRRPGQTARDFGR